MGCAVVDREIGDELGGRRAQRQSLLDVDRGDDARLQDRERGEDDDLRQQVCRRGQPDGLLAQEDRALADQGTDRQRGAHEDRADVEQHEDLARLVGRFTALYRGDGHAEADVARHRQRQHAHDERQERQEDEVPAVGDDQPDLAPGDRRELPSHDWFSSVCRGRPGVCAGGCGGAGPFTARYRWYAPRPGRARRR